MHRFFGIIFVSLLLAACTSGTRLTADEKFDRAIDHLTGEGAQQDTEKAVALLERAAEPEKYAKQSLIASLFGTVTPQEQGSRDAQRMLAQLYSFGQGVEVDKEQGVALYLKAAMQGDGAAQAALGIAYENGMGVPKDLPSAYAWFTVSVEMNENIDGAAGLERVEPQMHEEEIQRGEHLATALRRNMPW